MGRYLTTTTDRAESLEKWVKEVAAETSQRLEGAELYGVSIDFREPPFDATKDYPFYGNVFMKLKFSREEPIFLINDDRILWHALVRKIAGQQFQICPFGSLVNHSHLYFAGIRFEEPTAVELYILTPKKEATIRAGFGRVEKYANWYCSAVKGYGDVIAKHETAMQSFLELMEAAAGQEESR